jgi:hypothetical protein
VLTLDIRGGATCPACGPDQATFQFCEDCEQSDCAYCGVVTKRYLLSENFACAGCEGDGS